MTSRFAARRRVDAVIDRLRFALDTAPRLDYQPLPWLGKTRARRDSGTLERWAQIEPLLRDRGVRSSVDIGSNVGWFSIQMALMGIQAVAVEQESKFFRPLLYARERLKLHSLALLVTQVSEANVGILPRGDATLFLSVWHHLVRYRGRDAADSVLETLWTQTLKVLFFESGEAEIPQSWGLPNLSSAPDDFFRNYLGARCTGGEIHHLGRHPAFAPDGSPCERTLWAVVRTGD